jgi:RluA family pseudouridine synthase
VAEFGTRKLCHQLLEGIFLGGDAASECFQPAAEFGYPIARPEVDEKSWRQRHTLSFIRFVAANATGILSEVLEKCVKSAAFGIDAETHPRRVGGQPMPLPTVLFEDEVLIAFDKPSGLPVGADRREKSAENLTAMVREKMGDGIASVHRIDAEVSGIVLYAKTKPALDFVSGQFQSKTVVKLHDALVVGIPAIDNYTVDFFLKEDEAKPGTVCVVKKHGWSSETVFRVTGKYPPTGDRCGYARVECLPATSRMHQLRVHLAASGTPILNDSLYSDGTQLFLSDLKRGYKGRDDEKPLISRLALHAGGLTFTHPLTREKLTLTSPLPNDFAVALKYLDKFLTGKGRR